MYGCTVRYVERVFHTGSFIYVGTRTGVPAGCRDPGRGGAPRARFADNLDSLLSLRARPSLGSAATASTARRGATRQGAFRLVHTQYGYTV